MIEFTKTQRKAVASAVTALSAAVVVAFAAFVAWGLFKVLAFTSAALVPVFLGFLLALFFRLLKKPLLFGKRFACAFVLPFVCYIFHLFGDG